MTMKTHKILIIMAGLLFLSVSAIAQPAQRPQRQRFAQGIRMAKMLNLTQDQVNKLSDMRLAMQKEMLPLRNQMITLRGDLKLELVADNFNQRKVNKLVDQISDVRKQMNLKRISHMRDVRSILTPDQQKTFDLMIMQNKRGRFMQGRGMRGAGMRGNRPRGMWGPGPMRSGMNSINNY